MRVCFFGTYERHYPRNQILIKGMKSAGIDLVECHYDLWINQPHKVSLAQNPLRTSLFLLKLAFVYFQLLIRYTTIPKHDIVFFGYPGHIDVLALSWLPKLMGRKIVFDCFISLYDTVSSDRRLLNNSSLPSHLLKWVDRTSCLQSDMVLLDTNAHIDFFATEFKLPKQLFKRIFAGADTKLFSPQEQQKSISQNTFRILFIGKFTPLHGIDVILDAAEKLLGYKQIIFRLVGEGQLYEQLKSSTLKRSLSNIELAGWLPYEKLPDEINQSDLCLGVFSGSPKASRVIPNKIFQAMACQKPVLTARTRACSELFEENQSVFYVEPNNSTELADKILFLFQNRDTMRTAAINGFKRVYSCAQPDMIGKDLLILLKGPND